MLRTIERILSSFRQCFSREKCFKWFTVVASAFMLRSDRLGITSVIRDLGLSGKCYECLDHFFHSASFSLGTLRKRWCETVAKMAPLYRTEGRSVLIGDGVKQSKEGVRMPGVKRMVQESETCSKPEYIHGHMFGAVAVVAARLTKRFSIPLKVNIQDGLRPMASWPEAKGIVEISGKSHVEQMIESGFEAAEAIGRCFLLLDRYFLTRPAIELLDDLNKSKSGGDGNRVEVVTKAKSNCTAYRHPKRKKGARGRPPKHGKLEKLSGFFSRKRLFKETKVKMYGKEEVVSYLCLNLLWGKKLYRELRFVLVKYGDTRGILVSTDTTLSPERIIELYCLRFGIEECFREFKQQIGGLSYHFWTSSLPKLNHFAKKADPTPLEKVEDGNAREKIVSAVRAIESFVLFASIAMGTLQMIAMRDEYRDEIINSRYLRTYSNKVPSESSVMCYLRKRIFALLAASPDSFVSRYIREKHGAFFTQ